MTKTEELFGSDYAMLARKYGDDATQDAFEALLDMEARGKPITRSLLWTITQRKAIDVYRDDARERATAERLGNSNSLMRKQQGMIQAVGGGPSATSDPDDATLTGLLPGHMLGFPHNALAERTWS